jgi:hypothetical protein
MNKMNTPEKVIASNVSGLQFTLIVIAVIIVIVVGIIGFAQESEGQRDEKAAAEAVQRARELDELQKKTEVMIRGLHD